MVRVALMMVLRVQLFMLFTVQFVSRWVVPPSDRTKLADAARFGKTHPNQPLDLRYELSEIANQQFYVYRLMLTPPDLLLPLRTTVDRILPLPTAVWSDFSACWQPITVPRKTTLTSAGDVERYLYFVSSGLLRVYHLDKEGQKDTSLLFSYNGSFAGIADSFQLQQPSALFLETLTSSQLLRLPYVDFDRLTTHFPVLERWGRLATAGALSGLLERITDLMTLNAEDRFRTLLTRSPQVLNVIPHKYLASYLDLDASTFSKLLASVRL